MVSNSSSTEPGSAHVSHYAKLCINIIMCDSQCNRTKELIAPAHFSPGPDQIIPFKGCLVWGFGEQLSSYSVQPLQRDYNTQTHIKVGMENLYLGNPSHLMTWPSQVSNSLAKSHQEHATIVVQL